MKRLSVLLAFCLAGCATNPTLYTHTWTENGIDHVVKAKSLPFAFGKANLKNAETAITFREGDKAVTFGQATEGSAEAQIEALKALQLIFSIP